MPEEYLKIKANLLKQGKSSKDAKRLAAMIYNKRHPKHPMSPKYPHGR